MEISIHPSKLSGSITIPPSKSDAQRTYLAAALAKGTSVITGWGNSDDERAMRAAIQQLGAKVAVGSNGELHITGWKNTPSETQISAGESGLGIRLLTPVCATFSGTTIIKGEGSLQTRPMDFFSQNLPLFGASCETTNNCPPLTVQGPIKAANATVDGSLSSQFISGLLMALPKAEAESELTVTELKSGAYVDMTLQTLNAFGIQINRTLENVFTIPGNQIYQATDYHIDADWSSASYWLVAAALGHPIRIQGLRMDSLQADKALIGFLEAANCHVHIDENGIIDIDGTHRHAFKVDATDCPDLFPALVTLAAYIAGTTIISGANRLEHKESHRGLTLQKEFGKLGLKIDLIDDEMHIHGTGVVLGGTVYSHHDHRIAMCLGIAGTLSETPIEITEAQAISKSYPDFWDDLDELTI